MKQKQSLSSFFVLIAVVGLVVFVRIRLLSVPLERDEGEYAYAGQLMKQGIAPYSGVYNMKFPGTYFCYYLIETVFGETIAGIRFAMLLVNLLCIYFIFKVSNRLFNREAAFAAAATFALLSLSNSVQGFDALAEHFVILFVLPALLIFLKAKEKNSAGLLYCSGALFGIAIIMKQHGAAFAAFGLLLVVHHYFFREKKSFMRSIKPVLLFIAGVITPLAIMIIWLASAGILKNFWFFTFQYGGEYVTGVDLKNSFNQFHFTKIFNDNPLIWLLALSGVLILIFNKRFKQHAVLLLSLSLFSFISICPGFYFRPHYFILTLPAASLVTGVSFYFLSTTEFSKPRISILIIPALLALSAISFFGKNYGDLFLLAPSKITHSNYATGYFNEAVEIADYIKKHSSPDETIAVIGSEPEIYFYSHRHSATGYIYSYPLLENQKYRQQMQQQYFSEIEKARPEFVIVVKETWDFEWPARDTVINWCYGFIHTNYKCVGLVHYFNLEHPVFDWGERSNPIPTEFPNSIEVYKRI